MSAGLKVTVGVTVSDAGLYVVYLNGSICVVLDINLKPISFFCISIT
jgi:hypothetical protein